MFGKRLHEQQIMTSHLEMGMHQALAVLGGVAADLLGAEGFLVEFDRRLGIVVDRHMRDQAICIRHGTLHENTAVPLWVQSTEITGSLQNDVGRGALSRSVRWRATNR